MHAEWGEIDEATAEALNAARDEGGRIVCVGTTSARILESAADEQGRVRRLRGETARSSSRRATASAPSTR